MNKNISFSLIVLTAICSIVFGSKFPSSEPESIKTLEKANVESLTDCEAINGHKNDGHCTHDDYQHYFCKSPGFLQSKNCQQTNSGQLQ